MAHRADCPAAGRPIPKRPRPEPMPMPIRTVHPGPRRRFPLLPSLRRARQIRRRVSRTRPRPAPRGPGLIPSRCSPPIPTQFPAASSPVENSFAPRSPTEPDRAGRSLQRRIDCGPIPARRYPRRRSAPRRRSPSILPRGPYQDQFRSWARDDQPPRFSDSTMARNACFCRFTVLSGPVNLKNQLASGPSAIAPSNMNPGFTEPWPPITPSL